MRTGTANSLSMNRRLESLKSGLKEVKNAGRGYSILMLLEQKTKCALRVIDSTDENNAHKNATRVIAIARDMLQMCDRVNDYLLTYGEDMHFVSKRSIKRLGFARKSVVDQTIRKCSVSFDSYRQAAADLVAIALDWVREARKAKKATR